MNPKLQEGGSEILKYAMQLMNSANVDQLSTRVGFDQWSILHILALRGKMKSLQTALKHN